MDYLALFELEISYLFVLNLFKKIELKKKKKFKIKKKKFSLRSK